MCGHSSKCIFKHNKRQTAVSLQIKVLSEVEKIWILNDLDDSGFLDFGEIKQYLKEVACPHLNMTTYQILKIFESIDIDKNG